MNKIIALTLTIICIVPMIIGCSKQEAGGSYETIAVTSLEVNRIELVHETDKATTDFEVTITDEKDIKNILSIYYSMKINQTSKPLNFPRFIITFYHDDTKISVWWLDGEFTTACSAFEIGNHVIENKDFNYSYLEKFLKK